ncbi:short-chain dehydrogenase [Camillea tinctor]|nr:short-chain dehydrogenase [Camillea tinctor]
MPANPDRLAGQHVLVIGGSAGIGRGVVEAALAAGSRVTLTGSSQRSADAAVSAVLSSFSPSSSPAPQLTGLGCDLLAPDDDAVESALEDLFARVEQTVGAVDHVVLTAADGLAICGVGDLSAGRVRGVVRMRMLVPILLGKVAQKHFSKAKEEGEDKGKDKSLVFTTGGIADQPAPGWSLMSYVMAGTNALARNLALDLAPVRVNAVEPGAVDTGLWGGAKERADVRRQGAERLPTRRVADPADVAEAYVYLMRDRNATGEVVKTRGGAHLV